FLLLCSSLFSYTTLFRSWAVIGCGLIATTLSAGDWAEFRGPTGQGHAAGSKLPTEWSANKNVAWKAAIPGKGWSSPIIVGEHVLDRKSTRLNSSHEWISY